MSIGNKIKHLRELKNLSQDYMAKQLDISQKAYSNIENEVSEITVNRLENISKILGVSMTQILNLNEENIFQNIFNNQNESKNNYTVNNNHANLQKELYEKIIAEKEAHIVTLSQLLKTK
ncbi:MAG: helix-turn-helix transcriptional regulator [Bacteroidetes bacterium]|nr:helix-turn-helix transcriptional regulator [Bacteroidota bacterium]MBK8673806.1 helix-turn-helix transcriptional regulator [Bacteroidota bacterium]